MVVEWLFVIDTGEGTLHGHCLGLLGHRAIWVSRVIPTRWSWNDRMLCCDRGNSLYSHCSGLLGYRVLHISRVILWRCLEMEGCSGMIQEGTAWSLFRSFETQSSLSHYSIVVFGRDLEMAWHSMVQGGYETASHCWGLPGQNCPNW